NTLDGGAGNDRISTSSSNTYNTVYGGTGDDRISLSTFNDVAYGGDGADTVFGWHDSTIYGGDNDDLIFGDTNTSIEGGSGADTIYSSSYSTTYISTLKGGLGDD